MSKKVLVIEDNNDIRETVIEILELAGYQVFNASNGKTGVELALKNIPNIILCDVMMPEMDGYGVLYLLSKRPETAAVPFIFLTAKAEHFDRRKGMEMGADDYLTKPFDGMELLSAIESRLRKKDGQQAFYSKSLDQLNLLVIKSGGLNVLKTIIEERKARTFKKNQVVYYEGDKGTGLYIIMSGKVKSVKFSADGRELITGIYSKDDYLGVNAMLSNWSYSDTATVLEDSLLCLIPKEQLEQLLNMYPDVAVEFIKLLANEVREKEEQLLQMAYNSVRKKMAEVLLRLHKHHVNAIGSFSIAREDLAAMAAMATETVSRTLSDFKEERLIEKKGTTITIIDPDKLAKMKN